MRASARLLAFLEQWERFAPKLYNDAGKPDATIGFGHLVHRGAVGADPASEAPFLDGITIERARELLARDVRKAEWAVNALVTVPLTQSQFDVLVSFVYNIGAGAFSESTLRRLLNDRKYDAVPHELAKWHFEHKTPVLGLKRRRAAESAWWQEHDDALIQ